MLDKSYQKPMMTLRFVPFVLTNGMNLFPIFILAHLFLQHNRAKDYVLPLILYYCFKSTILFLIRLVPIRMNRLLLLSIITGVIGCLLGSLVNVHLIYGIMAGALLGICSGTLFPSYMTVQFHQKQLNDFGTTTKDQLYSLVFAVFFSVILFRLIAYSVPFTFLYLGINLSLLFFIVSSYPDYELEDNTAYPEYSVLETLFLFIVGFFSIFVLKGDKKLGNAHSLPLFFAFLCGLLVLYFFYLRKVNLERQFRPLATVMMIFKGMITNFVFVFCTMYQLMRHGKTAIHMVYSFYLLAIIIAPICLTIIKKKIKEENIYAFIFSGMLVSFVLLLIDPLFYVGVFMLSLFNAMYNQILNQKVYHKAGLPQDFRLVAKYRLGNIGSITHQLIMMSSLFLLTVTLHTASMTEIFKAYSFKHEDASVHPIFLIAKIILLVLFTVIIAIIYVKNKKEDAFES